MINKIILIVLSTCMLICNNAKTTVAEVEEIKSRESNLDTESVKEYMNEMFLEIVREPETVNHYRYILDTTGVESISEMQWYYENPKEMYDTAQTWAWYEKEGTLYGDTLVYSEILTFEGEAAWRVSWSYEILTGSVKIEQAEIEEKLSNASLRKQWEELQPYQSCAENRKIEDTQEYIQLKSHMSEEEIASYMDEMFMDIAQNPEQVEKYYCVLTEESVRTIGMMDWYYANPNKMYDAAETNWYTETESGYITGSTIIDYSGLCLRGENYIDDGTDVRAEIKSEKLEDYDYYFCDEPEVAWEINWYYEIETGIISIRYSDLVRWWG